MPEDTETEDTETQDSEAEGTFDAVQAAAELAAALARDPPTTEPSAGADNYTAILEDEVETLKGLLAEEGLGPRR